MASALPRHWPFGVPDDDGADSAEESLKQDGEELMEEGPSPSSMTLQQADIVQHAVDALNEAEHLNRRPSFRLPRLSAPALSADPSVLFLGRSGGGGGEAGAGERPSSVGNKRVGDNNGVVNSTAKFVQAASLRSPSVGEDGSSSRDGGRRVLFVGDGLARDATSDGAGQEAWGDKGGIVYQASGTTGVDGGKLWSNHEKKPKAAALGSVV